VDVFNEKCRSLVLTYVAEWRKTVTRMGRWVDFDNDYKTMDPTFMETIWWVFKQLWEQGRVYKSYRIMPYSWKLTTPLSNFEAGNNYQEVQDPAITVRLRFKRSMTPRRTEPWHALAWTTTPWTLPANLALCVGPEIDYVAVRTRRRAAYTCWRRPAWGLLQEAGGIGSVAPSRAPSCAASDYEPLLSVLSGQPQRLSGAGDGFVTTVDGTGIVHMAPAYGEDDFRVGKAAGIPPVDLLDENAVFTAPCPSIAGQFCKDADKASSAGSRTRGSSCTRRPSCTATRSASAPTPR
jgi:isoleucyl-tRNA synthetase